MKQHSEAPTLSTTTQADLTRGFTPRTLSTHWVCTRCGDHDSADSPAADFVCPARTHAHLRTPHVIYRVDQGTAERLSAAWAAARDERVGERRDAAA